MERFFRLNEARPDEGNSQRMQDPRWQAVVNRDARFDDQFYYSVRTTGVYCRPSCGARLARPENVAFHATCQAAEEAGFRPCKRCQPDQKPMAQQQADLIATLCRRIEAEAPAPGELAEAAGLSYHHFHRLFKAHTGLTPAQYARAHRDRRLRDQLQTAPSVTEAIYNAGFNSSGRFYESSQQLIGMTPTAYRKGGPSVQIRFAMGECSLGSILVARTNKGICAILLGENLLEDLQRRFPRAQLVSADADFEALVSQVIELVEAPGCGAALPLDVRGTAFQQRVWQALQQIPVGATLTYGELAQRIGSPGSVRAVAGACAANPLAVAIPCHRVVRKDGDLAGYRWGVERKRALLDREAGCGG